MTSATKLQDPITGKTYCNPAFQLEHREEAEPLVVMDDSMGGGEVEQSGTAERGGDRKGHKLLLHFL